MQINQAINASVGDVRPTYAEVNLSIINENLDAIRSKVKPSRVMLILKANAYGHGLKDVALHLADRVDYLGVAVLEEGVYLREIGIKTPILVMGGVWNSQIPLYIQNKLTLTASSVERLEQIDQIAESMDKKARVHLKIDTGMERIGVHYYSAETLLETALACQKNVEIEGIYSHFANSDSSDLTHSNLQLERFNEVLRFYENHSLPIPTRHMANSGAVLQIPESYFDMVRPGILMYGVYPSQECIKSIQVRPGLSWKSRVVYFKVVKPGHPVSYGSIWQSDHLVRVVTIPVGYGDGYFRSMSNKAKVIIRGKKYPQVGRVCMDQIMVNIEWGTAYNGDEVTLIGESGEERITVEDLACWADTIPYEILTNINARVPRVYIK
ncbi:MAG: alanine racemase [Chloroflexota bacterium]